jgi:hypothetical protein
MSRAPQAKGPGRSRPAAAGIVALGAAAISARVSAALEVVCPVHGRPDQTAAFLPFRAARSRRREAARL